MQHDCTVRAPFLHQAAATGALAALPAPLLAQAASQLPARSPFGSRSTAEDVTAGMDLSGLTMAITGCDSGLGLETMRVLALRGAHVIGIARSLKQAEGACARVEGDTTPEYCDLGEWDSVAACGQRIQDMGTPLDALITNAGIMALRELELVNGVEKQFAVNHLGHFILIQHLMDSVLAAAQGRFVLLSSTAHTAAIKGIEFDNLDGSRGYQPWKAYGVSKLANALCARALGARLSGTNATANSLHPGVIDTNLGKHMPAIVRFLSGKFGWLFMKSIPQGAATTCHVATSENLAGVQGAYFADCNVKKGSKWVTDDAMAEQLWQVSEELTADYLPTRG